MSLPQPLFVSLPASSVCFPPTFFCLLAVSPIINSFCRLSPHVMRQTMRVYTFNDLGIRLTGQLVQDRENQPNIQSALSPGCLHVVHCSLQAAFMLSGLQLYTIWNKICEDVTP